jgi:DNA-binding transcriptional ArsR family regulator
MSTTAIDSLLLYEVAPLERTSAELRDALRAWGYDLSPAEVVAGLRRLREQGLVDGASDYSRLFTVWPNIDGKSHREREARFRRLASHELRRVLGEKPS